jgi:hypothetical protein
LQGSQSIFDFIEPIVGPIEEIILNAALEVTYFFFLIIVTFKLVKLVLHESIPGARLLLVSCVLQILLLLVSIAMEVIAVWTYEYFFEIMFAIANILGLVGLVRLIDVWKASS